MLHIANCIEHGLRLLLRAKCFKLKVRSNVSGLGSEGLGLGFRVEVLLMEQGLCLTVVPYGFVNCLKPEIRCSTLNPSPPGCGSCLPGLSWVELQGLKFRVQGPNWAWATVEA